MWIAAGALAGDESRLTTDLDGEVRLAGVPSGRYSWTIQGAPSAGGVFQVAPLDTVSVPVVLP